MIDFCVMVQNQGSLDPEFDEPRDLKIPTAPPLAFTERKWSWKYFYGSQVIGAVWMLIHVNSGRQSSLAYQMTWGVSCFLGLAANAFLFFKQDSLAIATKDTFSKSTAKNLMIILLLLPSALLPLDYSYVKKLLYWVDSSLMSNYTDIKDYAENCAFNLSMIWSLVDVYCVYHFLGFMFKMLVFRDLVFVMFISVYWEISEVVFNSILPEFKECWWDSIILDVGIFNLLGIIAGHFLVKKLKLRNRCWSKITYPKKLNHTSRCDGSLDSRKSERVIFITLLSVSLIVLELNSFFLKHTYAPYFNHWLNRARLIFMLLFSYPVFEEQFGIVKGKHEKAPIFSWIFFQILILEDTLFISHNYEMATRINLKKTVLWVFGQILFSYMLVRFSNPDLYKDSQNKELDTSNFILNKML